MTSSHEDTHIWHPDYGAWPQEYRIEAVEMRLKGLTTREVAALFNVHKDTVNKWVRAWKQAQRNPTR